ncbi:MAG TPA: hypothetical protein VFS58_07035, partial [Steroidobacteraceae bacterium]|nr:hypothetical protein [Steroidobacteraceae bacterium]
WTRSTHWGLPSDFNSGSVSGQYAGFSSHVNIDWSCAPAVLVTRANHPSPVPKPQNQGAAPINGWYHLQYQATTGGNGTADFRIWANNNNQTSPSSEHLNMDAGLGTTGWDGDVNVVGYWGTNYQGTIGFVIDDFEIGPTFDPNWYPASGPRPNPPTSTTAQ